MINPEHRSNTVHYICTKTTPLYSAGIIFSYQPDSTWIPCDGAEFSPTEYPDLAAVQEPVDGRYFVPDLKPKAVDWYVKNAEAPKVEEPKEPKPVIEFTERVRLICAKVEILKIKCDHYLWWTGLNDDERRGLEDSLEEINSHLEVR